MSSPGWMKRLRWLREHREQMTDGQRKCLSNILRMARERCHHSSHYVPQIDGMYAKMNRQPAETGKPAAPSSDPDPDYVVVASDESAARELCLQHNIEPTAIKNTHQRSRGLTIFWVSAKSETCPEGILVQGGTPESLKGTDDEIEERLRATIARCSSPGPDSSNHN